MPEFNVRPKTDQSLAPLTHIWLTFVQRFISGFRLLSYVKLTLYERRNFNICHSAIIQWHAVVVYWRPICPTKVKTDRISWRSWRIQRQTQVETCRVQQCSTLSVHHCLMLTTAARWTWLTQHKEASGFIALCVTCSWLQVTTAAPAYNYKSSQQTCMTIITNTKRYKLQYLYTWQTKNGRRSVLSKLITALHGMQTRSYDENSVCPSVCPSNAWIVTKRKKNQSRFLHHTKDHSS